MRLRNPYAKMPDGKAAPEWRGAWGNAAADWQDNPGVAAQLSIAAVKLLVRICGLVHVL